jgi:hypothetical protein
MSFTSGSNRVLARSRWLRSARRRLQAYAPYVMARELKWCVESRMSQRGQLQSQVASLTPEKSPVGDVLLSYRIEAFLLKPGESVPNSHTNYWESLQIARTFVDLGYSVDVISFLNWGFELRKDYSIVIDARRNLERLAPGLDPRCIKMMHLDTSHILFHNAAEARRLLELQQRRGVTLAPARFEMPNLGMEVADCATTPGNDVTIGTYRYAGKPIFRVPLPAAITCPWPARKDFEGCRRRFVWFGSGGLVHKGLDLTLEVFAGMPDYHLTVCGPIEEEEAFVRAYRKELYHTPNITTMGWVDVESPRFTDITDRAIGLVYPSCSEGAAAAVITCMHAGLIPLASQESGVDLDDFGAILKTCSLDEIRDTVRAVSDLPSGELERRARRAWEFARANHTRERFAEEYRRTAERIIATYGSGATRG